VTKRAILMLLVVGAALSLGWRLQPLERAGAEEAWCGTDPTSDWVCPLSGSVFAARRRLAPEVAAPLSGSRLTTGPGSAAHLTFRDQANCTLNESSLIFPRVGRPDTLFTQKRGSASCESSRPGRVRIYCGPVEPCPTELRAQGEFLFKSLRPPGAQAASTTTRRRRIVIVACDGLIEVWVKTPGGTQYASGGGSSPNRLEIVIEVVSKVVRSRWGGSVYQSGKVVSKGEAGTEAAQDCEASFSQEEESTVMP
jgi:hypothetical protein